MREEDLERLLGDVHGDDPSPQFVTSLRARLDQELAEGPPPDGPLGDRSRGDDDMSDISVVTPPGDTQRAESAKWWIRGGLAVAAAALIVVGIVVADDGQDAARLATEGGDPAADTVPPGTDAPDTGPAGELGTGDVQVTLRWTGGGDPNLFVAEPSGDVIGQGSAVQGLGLGAAMTSASGGRLEGNDFGRCGEPEEAPHAENVFWPAGGAPSGEYRAFITGKFGCGGPLDYTIEVKVLGEVVVSESGSIVAGEVSPQIAFEVP